MVTPPFITKLYMPLPRPELVARPQLVERLNANLLREGHFSRRLTVAAAPAGFGKTTLIAEWLRQTEHPFTWLSLDEHDNDPNRFLVYLIAALRRIRAEFGGSIQSYLQSPQPPPPEAIAAALVHELTAIPVPFIVALDDFHAIQNPLIHQQINAVLEYQPRHMHLVIISREDPPLPISRWRAQGQVTEIRQADLCFSQQEAGEFLRRTTGLTFAAEDVEALARRTEGWVVGLQMAALSLQGEPDVKGFIRSFTGSQRYILDYLMEEVLSKQPAAMQEFLLQTSILDRLAAPLCDAVTDRHDSFDLLRRLEVANVFLVPLDADRQWYRYHHLFAELLRHRLQVSDALAEAVLHRRASQWFEQNGHPLEAIHHALAAADWDGAARLIHLETSGMLKRGELTTLLGWLKKLPHDQVIARPQLSIDLSWPLVLTGQLDMAERLLTPVEQQVGNDLQLQAEIATQQAYIARARGDHRRTVELSQRALSLLSEADRPAREVLAVNLGIAHWHNGQLDDAERVFTEARRASAGLGNRYADLTIQIFLNRILAARGHLRSAGQAYQPLVELKGQIPILALAQLDVSTLHYEWNDLEACTAQLDKCITLSEQTRNVEFQVSGQMQLARLKLACGDVAGASQALAKNEPLLQEHAVSPLTRERNAAMHVQLALRQGDLAGAAACAREAGDHADAHPFYPMLGLSRARVLLAEQRLTEAAAELSAQFEFAARAGWRYGQIAVRSWQAVAAGRSAAAVDFLSEALQWAQPNGFIRTFVDVGKALTPVLEEAARRGVMPEYVGTLLTALGSPKQDRQQVYAAGDSSLLEPLSGREIEVLRLAAAGRSNRQIAKTLVVSLGTVKTHLHHIYGKLGAANRAQAVDRARELHLI
jgi:LuxR family transcriptional regulator, maltose regulon positive regulatory protein